MKLSVKIAGIFAVVAFALTAVGSANAAFTRDLTIGSTGADVIELQTWLETKGLLMIPAGVSKGYFGTLTQMALAKYQASVGIVPAVGYFGPITRAKIAMGGTVTPPVVTPPGDLEGGEASLESFDLSSGDDFDVEEGASGDVAEIEFDVEDGDIMIDRIDFALVADSGNDESDPWDTFESITLSVDGKEIADADLSDEDEYLDEDDGTFRISGIDYKVAEGETVNIVVSLTAQNSVDGADTSAAGWTISVDGTEAVRATDGEGIQQYTGSASDEVEFDIEVEGDGEELNVTSSNDDIDSDTFMIEDDAKSDEYSIFAFDLEAEESDVEINEVHLNLTTSTSTANMISELVLEIDGEEFDDWSYTVATGAASSTRGVTFDIDGDYTLDADSEVTVVLKAEFKAANQPGFYSATTTNTIVASIGANGVEGEGADDVNSAGTAAGDTHYLAIEGVTVSAPEVKDAEVHTNDADSATDDEAEFTFEFEVEAFEESAFVKLTAARGTTTSPSAGINYVIETSDGFATTTGTVNATVELIEDGDEDGGYAEVSDGQPAKFRVIVNFNAGHPTGSGVSYRARLDSVNFNDTATTPDSQQFLVPSQDYRTSFVSVQN
jgi:hypothetical protein